MECVLYIRLAADCGHCVNHIQSGLIDHIKTQVTQAYPNVEVVEDLVPFRVLGNASMPDVFNELKVTPYFCFLTRETYDELLTRNTPLKDVWGGLLFYNIRATCPGGKCVFSHERKYGTAYQDMLDFCRDSYTALTGEVMKPIIPPPVVTHYRQSSNSVRRHRS